MNDSELLARAGISRREREVLEALASQRTHVEIAADLFISVRTVESHVASLRRKLDLPDHRSLVRFAVHRTMGGVGTHGLVSVGRLPVALTSFVGRSDERRRLAAALTESRMVSAIGPGGVGKTRLAVAVAADVADRFLGGVCYVDLVPVTDPAFVPAAVATACGINEMAGRSVQDLFASRFAGRPTLLLIDNCEHVADSVAVFIEAVLSVSADIVVLVTSRVRLVVPHERVFGVAGLSLDDQPEDGSHDDDSTRHLGVGGDAAVLFAERAVAAGWTEFSSADWNDAAAACRALDGQALAIELAAARLPVLGWELLKRSLIDQMPSLEGGARVQVRHRSLQEMLDWSYRLLTATDQAVLRRLSVFAGAFTASAATDVVTFGEVASAGVPAALGRLADHCLLAIVDASAGPRYRALEVVRQYGTVQIETRGEDTVYTHHLRWCLRAAGELDSTNPDVDAFEAIADDLRSAAAWASKQEDRRAEAEHLASRFAALLFARGRASEAQIRFEQAAGLDDVPRSAVDSLLRAAATAACRVAGEDTLRLYQRAADKAIAASENALGAYALARGAETIVRFQGMFVDPPGVTAAQALIDQAIALGVDDPRANAAILAARANVADPADPDSADLAERAINAARTIGEPVLQSSSVDALLLVLLEHGDPVAGANAMASRVAMLSDVPKQPDVALELKDALHGAVLTSIGAGDLASARMYAEQQLALPYLREERDLAIETLLAPEALAGNFDRVRILSEQFRESWESAGSPRAPGRGIAPAAVVMVHALRGDHQSRDAWLDVLARIRAVPIEDASRGCGYGGLFDIIVLLHHGRVKEARRVVTREAANSDRWYWMLLRHWYVALDAEAAVLCGDPAAEQIVHAAADQVRGNPTCSAIVDRAEALLRNNNEALQLVAARLGRIGHRYQRARTLVLADDPFSRDGQAELAAIGATPVTQHRTNAHR